MSVARITELAIALTRRPVVLVDVHGNTWTYQNGSVENSWRVFYGMSQMEYYVFLSLISDIRESFDA